MGVVFGAIGRDRGAEITGGLCRYDRAVECLGATSLAVEFMKCERCSVRELCSAVSIQLINGCYRPPASFRWASASSIESSG
jgi:hypothetical protein